MSNFHMVHLEGGPRDGESLKMCDASDTLFVPLRLVSTNVLSDYLKPPTLRKGMYLRDELDNFTLNWQGEV